MTDRVLFITPNRRDAGAISRILAPTLVEHARDVAAAAALLRRQEYGALLTESRLPDGSWRDVLDTAARIGRSCPVIVTDRVADDLFWSEVLNLGAYDLLAQPFDETEVRRIVESARMAGATGSIRTFRAH